MNAGAESQTGVQCTIFSVFRESIRYARLIMCTGICNSINKIYFNEPQNSTQPEAS